MSFEQQTVFVAHWSINSHKFPFNIPKLSNFPVKQPKLNEDEGVNASSVELLAAVTKSQEPAFIQETVLTKDPVICLSPSQMREACVYCSL